MSFLLLESRLRLLCQPLAAQLRHQYLRSSSVFIYNVSCKALSARGHALFHMSVTWNWLFRLLFGLCATANMGQLDKAPKWATDWSSRGSLSSNSSSAGNCSLHSASDLSDEDFLSSSLQNAASRAANDCSAVGQLATGQSQYSAACTALRVPPSSSVLNKLSSEQLHITTMLSGGAGLALAKALAVNCCLRVLQLRNTNLGEAGCTAVAEALHGKHHRIAKLDLSGNMVSTAHSILHLHCCSY
jgi:hypothetical protein